MTHKPLLLVLAMTLGGCSLIPDYQRPEAPVPSTFPEGAAYAAPSSGGVAGARRDRRFTVGLQAGV